MGARVCAYACVCRFPSRPDVINHEPTEPTHPYTNTFGRLASRTSRVETLVSFLLPLFLFNCMFLTYTCTHIFYICPCLLHTRAMHPDDDDNDEEPAKKYKIDMHHRCMLQSAVYSLHTLPIYLLRAPTRAHTAQIQLAVQ